MVDGFDGSETNLQDVTTALGPFMTVRDGNDKSPLGMCTADSLRPGKETNRQGVTLRTTFTDLAREINSPEPCQSSREDRPSGVVSRLSIEGIAWTTVTPVRSLASSHDPGRQVEFYQLALAPSANIYFAFQVTNRVHYRAIPGTFLRNQ